jgi:hypothetical protein
VVKSVVPSKLTKSIVPVSLIKSVPVCGTKPVSTVEPEKNPLSSASLVTIPLINWILLCWFSGKMNWLL